MEAGDYNLEIDRVLGEIDRAEAKKVLIQLPDGLKQYADKLQRAIVDHRRETSVFFWSGSCYGACDVPLHVRELGFDLLIQFGHAPWKH